MGKPADNILVKSDIRLRAVEPDDAAFLCSVENDSSHWLENGLMAPVSMEFMSVYASTYEPDSVKTGQLRLVVELRESGVPIGVADIFDIDWRNLHGEVGIYILNEYRKKSYALQALNSLCSYAGTILGLNALMAKVSSSNIGSGKLFTRAGFNLSGTLRDWIRNGSVFSDLDIYTRYPNEPDEPDLPF